MSLNIQATIDAAFAEIDAANAALTSTNAQLVADNAHLATANHDLSETVDDLQAEVNALTVANTGLTTQVANLNNSNLMLATMVADLEEEIEELEEQLANQAPSAPLPTMSISNAGTVAEAAGTVTFTVSLSAAYTSIIDVDYTTMDGTATAGQDFTAKSGSLRFNPGETTKTVAVTLLNDALVESNEALTLQLSNARVLINLNPSFGTVTITSEDTTPPVEPPASGVWPTAATAGVRSGVNLVASTKRVYETANEKVSGKIFTGDVTVYAPGVEFIDCQFKGATYRGVWFRPAATGGKVQYCDVLAGGKGIVSEADDCVFVWNDVRGVVDGIEWFGNNNLCDHNYVHDLVAPSGAHNDGIACEGPNSVITWNYVDNPQTQTSALMVSSRDHPMPNIVVENNYLKGGGYTLYWVDNITNGKFNYNTLHSGYYGNLYVNAPFASYVGNKLYDKNGNPA